MFTEETKLKIYAKLQLKFRNEFGTKGKLQDFKIVYPEVNHPIVC